jgi:hypothetical protein
LDGAEHAETGSVEVSPSGSARRARADPASEPPAISQPASAAAPRVFSRKASLSGHSRRGEQPTGFTPRPVIIDIGRTSANPPAGKAGRNRSEIYRCRSPPSNPALRSVGRAGAAGPSCPIPAGRCIRQTARSDQPQRESVRSRFIFRNGIGLVYDPGLHCCRGQAQGML